MLSSVELAALERELSATPVLSVYIAAEEHDPRQRSIWRTRLAAELDAVENELSADAQDAFVAARRLLEAELQPHTGFLRGRGWAAFVTSDLVWYCAEVPAPMPDLVRWRTGPVLGPLLRALKQTRPVIVVLLDQRRARVLRYRLGELTETVDYRSDEFLGDLSDQNMSKRAAVHSGVRGATATDAAERLLRQAAERLQKHVAHQIELSEDALLVLGGPTMSVAALLKLLERKAADRVTVEPTLQLLMSPSEIQPLIEAAASRLSQRLQLGLVREVCNAAGSDGLGVLGRRETGAAAVRGQIDRLLLTPRCLGEHEEDAERLIAATLAHAGAVELVSDEAAELLDDNDGAGAVLRFTIAAPGLVGTAARQK